MKKLLACVLALILIGCAALAEIDLSSLSYEELVALRQQVDATLWASEEWQEVEVPAGVYIIGEDIPAGRYVLSFTGSSIGPVNVYPTKEAYIENGFDTIVQEYLNPGDKINLLVDDGQYLELIGASNTYLFAPYTGAALGFK